MTRYRADPSARQHGAVVIGGSPLRLFRLSTAGAELARRALAGETVPYDAVTAALLDRLLDAGAIHPQPDGGALGPGDVTMVVPARDAAPRALARIVESCRDVAAVVLVDDGSDPPIGTVAGARVVTHDRNRGPGAARNTGAADVSSALVAFVDTDVELSAGWLDPLLAHFADPRVGLVAPRVVSVERNTRLARYERRHSPLDLGAEPARVAPGTRVSYVPAAAIVVRTVALRAIGGFDEALRFGEDVDAVWRLHEAGWRSRYEPLSVVGHQPRPTWWAFVRQRVAYGRSAAPLARRHHGTLAPVRVSGWSAGAWALAALGHPIAAVTVAAGTAVALVRKLPDVPAEVSLSLAGLGHLHAGRLLADAARRAWWPAVIAAGAHRRTRRLAVLAALPALVDGGPIRVVDDLAYGLGLWRGVIEARHAGPLIPDLSSWPGRTRS